MSTDSNRETAGGTAAKVWLRVVLDVVARSKHEIRGDSSNETVRNHTSVCTGEVNIVERLGEPCQQEVQ